MVETVLVAARGPVACAVVRTCQRLGVRAVTVHSEADAEALHVAEADDSVLVGPAPPEQSYLDPLRVVEAAQQAGAQAVHPGAGALAVDPAAARAVLDAGLTWVGAAPEALEAARGLARGAEGRRVTVVVVAPAGGPAVAVYDLERVDALDPCAVLASPAPGLDVRTRAAVAGAAVRIVEHLGVRGVASVEVQVTPDRVEPVAVRCALPVEHPVAALRTGVDLVEAQLRAAAGEPAPVRPVERVGAALSLRVYAVGLGPDGARVARFVQPAGARVERGCREGDLVSPWYDPLLATVTVAGRTGGEVLSQARAAVRDLVVEGLPTNLPELRALLADPSFAAA